MTVRPLHDRVLIKRIEEQSLKIRTIWSCAKTKS